MKERDFVAAKAETFAWITLRGEAPEWKVTGVKKRYARKTLCIPDGVRVIGCDAFGGLSVREIVLPDGVAVIEKNAFKDCARLEKIFIPKSVKEIGDDAFCGCFRLTIYCEDAPQPGWLDQPETKTVRYDDMTDAFNFHRSAGSFDDLYLVEHVEITHNNYNPDRRPVLTDVSREEFLERIKTGAKR